jgi:DNA-binding PadR family transcriptional regulator
VPSDTLSTTSYAILSLLAVKPWSAYDLASQMSRSLRHMWPRAVSVVYEEPKKLVRLGLAESSVQASGRRTRTEYAISPEGRRVLAGWLAQPGEAPVVEHEALLKVAFADQGSLAGLRDVVADAHTEAAERRDRIWAELAGFRDGKVPMPERLPVMALAGKLLAEQAELLLRWSEWAESEIAGWQGITPSTGAHVPSGAFELGWPGDSALRGQ